MSVDFIPEDLVNDIRSIGEEVKYFVHNKDSYYGVTRPGFVFDIIQGHSLQGPISDENDFHTYMWARCVSGFYLLRQRFLNGIGQEWFLEAEIIPIGNSWQIFQRLREIFLDDPTIMDRICGPAHETPKAKFLKDFAVDQEDFHPTER